jgi:two-component system nitrate/nitrite response regulator NarL
METEMSMRLVLADDHPLILQALEHLLELQPDFQVLTCCATVEETLHAVRHHRPDILILDLRMPDTGGLTVLRRIKEEELPTRVVLLTGVVDEAELLEAISLGACGVVLKDKPPDLVLQCVRAVHAGAQWLERGCFSQTLDKLLQLEARKRQLESRLTIREIEILRMVDAGLRNKEIGSQLAISEGTVKIHLHHIFEKLSVGSRLELLRYAKANGLF